MKLFLESPLLAFSRREKALLLLEKTKLLTKTLFRNIFMRKTRKFSHFLLLFNKKFVIIYKNEPVFERIFANGNFIFCFCLLHAARHR